MDEMVLPYFEQLESYENPLLAERHRLDRERFKSVVDQFYALHGWDVKSGWPTRERLRELGIEQVYEPMVEGAVKAQDRLAVDTTVGDARR
jgi:aldehyde:ferredoxin oxidoreductase